MNQLHDLVDVHGQILGSIYEPAKPINLDGAGQRGRGRPTGRNFIPPPRSGTRSSGRSTYQVTKQVREATGEFHATRVDTGIGLPQICIPTESR